MAATKIGHGLAKGLGIKLNYRNELNEEILRGESVFSSQTAGTYVEEEPTTLEWARETIPNGQEFREYCYSLFPFLHWIGAYNLQWLAGDLVAGKHPNMNVISYSDNPRNHNRCCCRTSRYGLRRSSWLATSIRSLLLLHGCSYLLVLRHLKRYHYWCKFSICCNRWRNV